MSLDRSKVGRAIEKGEEQVEFLTIRRDVAGSVVFSNLTTTSTSVSGTNTPLTVSTGRGVLAVSASLATANGTAATGDFRVQTANGTLTTLLTNTNAAGSPTTSTVLSTPANPNVTFAFTGITNTTGSPSITATISVESRLFGP